MGGREIFQLHIIFYRFVYTNNNAADHAAEFPLIKTEAR